MHRFFAFVLAATAVIFLAADPLVCPPDCNESPQESHSSPATDGCALCHATIPPATLPSLVAVELPATETPIRTAPSVPISPAVSIEPPPRRA